MDTQTLDHKQLNHLNFDDLRKDILSVMPHHQTDLTRLARLSQQDKRPTVTVIGKYNHGKSRLLNELIGDDIFAVADKRETVKLSEHFTQDIRWLDAPGLDADVAQVDDQYAFDAIWMQADIRLFIHSIREGEFDGVEQSLLHELIADKVQSQRQTILVLTQIDQMPDQAIFTQIQQSIQQQIPQLSTFSVSATRHRQGVEKGKSLLVEKSGILQLHQAINEAISQVPQGQAYEKNQILENIKTDIEILQHQNQLQIQRLLEEQQQQASAFVDGLVQVLDQIQIDLDPIVNITGQDHALEAESFARMFKMSTAKQHRAEVQVAYSKACITLNSHLIRHGVVGLPAEQQTHVQSLDTVIVAVLGISVKFRKHLKELFYTHAERQRLITEFTYYFEQSVKRTALIEKMQQYHHALKKIQKAEHALEQLEDVI